MSGSWGNNFRVSVYGESHGTGVGVLVDGLPGGITFPYDIIKKELYRRKPGKGKFSTQRQEDDQFEVISGVFEGKTTGTPINIFIKNKDVRSRDYSKTKDKMRPSHADYTGKVKYYDSNDYRGGGHFSGRLTAGLVIAGAIAKSLLASMGIFIGAHIKEIHGIKDRGFKKEDLNRECLEKLSEAYEEFPLLDYGKRDEMKSEILKQKEKKDSVGGIIEAGVIGIKAGVGNPFFGSVESRLSSMMFSVPAVKGIEFGLGFQFSDKRGSECNDSMGYEQGRVIHHSNNNGGVIGGITNGMPIVFRVVLKPTPSIGKEQNTIDIEKTEECVLQIEGRHDPCIVARAVPVIECATAIALMDMVMERIKEDEGFRRFT